MGNDNILVIGIAGGSASGKTTLMKNLIADCEDEVTVLSHDNYYKRHDELTMEERSRLNYDEPDAFDTSLMVYHLDQLRHGHAVECPVYDSPCTTAARRRFIWSHGRSSLWRAF